MRYIFELAGTNVRFTHAGHGTGKAGDLGRSFKGIRTRNIGRRNLFMHRNPLDTAISLYFQVHKTDFAPGATDYAEKHRLLTKQHNLPPEDLTDFVMHPVWGIENICRFNRAWLNFFSRLPDTMILSYEQMRKDTHTELPKVLDFVGAQNYDVDDIIARSSFSSMKKLEASSPANDRLRLHGNKADDPEAMKVRKGKVGGYADYLDADSIAASREIASRYGLEI